MGYKLFLISATILVLIYFDLHSNLRAQDLTAGGCESSLSAIQLRGLKLSAVQRDHLVRNRFEEFTDLLVDYFYHVKTPQEKALTLRLIHLVFRKNIVAGMKRDQDEVDSVVKKLLQFSSKVLFEAQSYDEIIQGEALELLTTLAYFEPYQVRLVCNENSDKVAKLKKSSLFGPRVDILNMYIMTPDEMQKLVLEMQAHVRPQKEIASMRTSIERDIAALEESELIGQKFSAVFERLGKDFVMFEVPGSPFAAYKVFFNAIRSPMLLKISLKYMLPPDEFQKVHVFNSTEKGISNYFKIFWHQYIGVGLFQAQRDEIDRLVEALGLI